MKPRTHFTLLDETVFHVLAYVLSSLEQLGATLTGGIATHVQIAASIIREIEGEGEIEHITKNTSLCLHELYAMEMLIDEGNLRYTKDINLLLPRKSQVKQALALIERLNVESYAPNEQISLVMRTIKAVGSCAVVEAKGLNQQEGIFSRYEIPLALASTDKAGITRFLHELSLQTSQNIYLAYYERSQKLVFRVLNPVALLLVKAISNGEKDEEDVKHLVQHYRQSERVSKEDIEKCLELSRSLRLTRLGRASAVKKEVKQLLTKYAKA